MAVVPHIICGGFTKEETENALLDLNFLGMNNVLAIRGDAPADTKIFVPEEGGHHHALDIVKQIVNLNKGIYLDKELKNKKPTSFSNFNSSPGSSVASKISIKSQSNILSKSL